MAAATAPRLDELLAAELPPAIREVASWPAQQRAAIAEAAVDIIAGGADSLFATGRTPRGAPTAGDVRTALIRGLAILAQRETGVTFAGITWTADGGRSGEWSIPPHALCRQARGAYFTPPAVAETVTAGTLDPLIRGASADDITQLDVADIACGAGAFLVAATRHLARALVDAWASDEDDRDQQLWALDTDDVDLAARVTVLDTCIYGVDVDPLSADLARIAVQLLVPDRRPPAAVDQIKVADALVGATFPGWRSDAPYPPDVPRFDWAVEYPYIFDGSRRAGFSAVLGNPPYLGGQKLTSAFGTDYRNYLIHGIAGGARGSADLAAYVTIRAAELCDDLGVIGLIAVNTLVQGATGRVLTAGLNAMDWVVHRHETLAWPGANASVECIMVWLSRHRAIPPDLRNDPDAPETFMMANRIPYLTATPEPYPLWTR